MTKINLALSTPAKSLFEYVLLNPNYLGSFFLDFNKNHPVHNSTHLCHFSIIESRMKTSDLILLLVFPFSVKSLGKVN